MKLTKRQRRTARKLILPAIAIGMMTTMMFLESAERRAQAAASYTPPAHASHTPSHR